MSPHSDDERLAVLTSWHSAWHGLRVAVLGLGVAGFAAADTLAELGASVLVLASSASAERVGLVEVIGAEFVEIDDAQGPGERLIAFDPELVIVSPGFPAQHPLLLWARHDGIAVWGEVELAWRLRDKTGRPADWLAVTGAHGTAMTVQLTATMLAAAGHRVAPCGDIGTPALDVVVDPAGFDVVVIALSASMLRVAGRTVAGRLSPYSSVCLNVSGEDGILGDTGRAHAAVYENTRVACVYNRADQATEAMVRDADVVDGARAIGFGLGVPGPSDLGVVDGILCDRAFLDDRLTTAVEIVTLDELRVVGLGEPALVAAVLAASALARSYGVAPAAIREALRSFTGALWN